jgi:hypothetical protein
MTISSPVPPCERNVAGTKGASRAEFPGRNKRIAKTSRYVRDLDFEILSRIALMSLSLSHCPTSQIQSDFSVWQILFLYPDLTSRSGKAATRSKCESYDKMIAYTSIAEQLRE